MNSRMKYLFKLVGITGIVYLSFRFLLPLVILFVLALLSARAMAPAINWIYLKLHISKKITAPLILLLSLAIIGGFLGILFVALAEQITDLVYTFPRFKNLWYGKLTDICNHCDGMFGLVKGNSLKVMDEMIAKSSNYAMEQVIPTVTGLAGKVLFIMFQAMMAIFIFFVSVLMFLSDRKKIKKAYKNFPLRKMVQPILSELKRNGLIYMKAQGIIIALVAVVCSASIFFIGNKYYLLFGIAIAILDAFPVVGSGSILVPWAIFATISGNYLNAAILVTGYIITLLIREVLEPKLLGNSMGILPVFMLMSIYVGFSLFGFTGIVLGPIGFVMIQTLMKIESFSAIHLKNQQN